jgi:hypothetical protein
VKRITNDGAGLVLNGYFNEFNGKSCGYMVRLDDVGKVDETLKKTLPGEVFPYRR